MNICADSSILADELPRRSLNPVIKLTFLGVGGAMASHPADNHTALLVEHADLLLLMDCGPTIMRQLERAGLTAGDPTHLYLSHQHGDHLLGLPMLLLNRVLFWPNRPLCVVAEGELLALAQQIVRIAYPDLELQMSSTVQYAALKTDESSDLPATSGARYTLAAGRHSVPTWAIRLDFAAGSLVYSSDTGRSEEIARLAVGTDTLVHEAYFVDSPEKTYENHSLTEDVAALAQQAGAKTLALVHRKDPSREAASAYYAAAARYFNGVILTPQAGDSYQF